jgi:hypothetical protein
MSANVSGKNVYVRNEVGIRHTPAWVILTMPLVFVALVGSIILCAWCGFHDKTVSVVGVILLVLSLFWSIFSEYFYDYYEGCKICFNEKNFSYEYNLNGSVVSSSSRRVVITVNSITDYKIKGSKILIWGDITKKAPFKNKEVVKKVELPINFAEEKVEIIDKISKYKH